MLSKLDHPLFFALAITLVVTATQRLAGAGAARLGWTGIATFFGKK
jgi:hypothetical protein